MQIILYFVEVQLAFAVLVALQCAFVLGLSGVYVSFQGRKRQAWAETFLPDSREEVDFPLFDFHERR